jgi:4-aminobutyrate aminotransferase / (S)-3-amino-2-methylpropionate transaminase / 5-aminovalerate transaminase
MKKGQLIGEKRDLPGDKSAELLKLRNEYVPRGVSYATPIFIASGKESVIEDVDGNQYLDFASGISTLNLGYCNDEIGQAIKEQMNNYLHSCFQVVMYEPYVKLAQKLAEVTPGNFPKQTMLVNSGAEAVENAVKIARLSTGRRGVIAFEHAFHGRTSMAMGLTSQVKNYKLGFGPFDPAILRYPYAYTYRASFKTTEAEYGKWCIKQIENGFKTQMPAEEIAAVIVEPFLGEGGYVIPPQEFLQGLRQLCDKYGILFIADEIQSGMGRTGKLWAVEHFDIVPDILLAAKTLGGGLVLSAVVGKKEIMESVEIGGIGGTFGGNPLSCVAALKTFEIIERDKLLERATKIGKYARNRLIAISDKYSLIGDVRGLGCAIGIEFVKDRETKEPAEKEVTRIKQKCLERGLITLPAGALHNVLRLMFPIIIKEQELDTGLDILEVAIKEVNAE